MKKAGALLTLLAVAFFTGCGAGETSVVVSSQPPPASSAVVRAPEQGARAEHIDSFGMLQYVDGEDIFLREGLGFFFGSENEALTEALDGLAYTYFPPNCTWEAGWHGRRLYEMDGYLLSVIMFGISGAQSEEDERLYIGYNILLDEKHVLESGLHVGMTLEEAKSILEDNDKLYRNIDDIQALIQAVENEAPVTMDESLAYDHLCWFHFADGLFDDYESCLVFAYQLQPNSLGRSMCMYADGEGIIRAIASPYYMLP